MVAFSLSGDQIAPGTGPLAYITYQSTSIYESSITLDFTYSVLADDTAIEIPHVTESGNVLVSGEEPPPEPPLPPTGVAALADDSQVSLNWNASFNTDYYNIYREEGSAGGSANYNLTIDGGTWQSEISWELELLGTGVVASGGCPYSSSLELQSGTYVMKMSDSWGDGWNGNVFVFTNDSGQTVASGTLDNGDYGEITFTLGDDNGGGGGDGNIGDSCNGCTSGDCLYDCQLQCVDSATVDSWLGDGSCDDGSFGIYLDCDEFNNDAGDCDGGGGGGDLSCVGNCDNPAPGGCYCDDACVQFGDCCDDACSECGYCGRQMTELYNSTHNELGQRIDAHGNVIRQFTINHPVKEYYSITTSREFELIGSVDATDYLDLEVLNGTEYCYYVTAVNVAGESGESATVCATPEGPPPPPVLDPPTGLTAEGEFGNIYIDWDSPEGGGGGPGGDPGEVVVEIFTDQYPSETSWSITSSSGQVVGGINEGELQVPENLESWSVLLDAGSYTFTINDSWGDGICCGYGYGYYNLYVDGTLVGSGGEFGSQESIDFNTSGFVSSITTGFYAEPHGYAKGEVIDNIDDLVVEYSTTEFSSRDLLGYNVFRDGSFIATTEATEYNDSDVALGVQYCYTVTAVYDEGESEESNQDCATAIDPGSVVQLSLTNGFTDVGDTDDIDVLMNNDDPVAGFQFTVDFDPNIASVINVETTARTEGFTVSENNGIIVGFSLTGATITPGDGSILNITVGGDQPGNAESCLEDVVLSDTNGSSMLNNSSCGSFNVDDIPPPDAIDLVVDNATLSMGTTASFGISMSNDVPVGGFQFNLSIDPDIATILSVETTARTEGFTISEGNGTILGFSLTGASILPGDGDIVTITANGDQVGTASSCLSSVVLSDPLGGALPVDADCGIFTVQEGDVTPSPFNVSAIGGDNQIEINWDWDQPVLSWNDNNTDSRETVNISISYVDDSTVEIEMENSVPVAGFQMTMDSDITGFSVTGAGGGRAGDAGFTMSTNASGTVLGFSLTGATISEGNGTLVFIDVSMDGQDGCVEIVNPVFSDASGAAIDVGSGEAYCIGEIPPTYGCNDPEADNYDSNADGCSDDPNDFSCCIYPECCDDPTALNYDSSCNDGCSDCCIFPDEVSFNVYRDGSLYAADLETFGYNDTGLDFDETHCYSVTAVLNNMESNQSEEACATTNSEPEIEPVNFIINIDETGVSQLVIIENIVGDEVEIGDEVGIFDTNGVVETCDPVNGCTDPIYGEVLVGSGVWIGGQFEVSAIMSQDLSDFGGPILNGAVDGNNIVIRYWDASEDRELDVDANFTTGSGEWGDIFTSVVIEPIYSVTQEVTLNAFMLNSVSLNVIPDDASLENVLADIPVLIMSDDNGDFYAPSFGVNQIGDFGLEGYSCFISGASDYTVSVEGMPVEQTTPLLLEAFKVNILPYLPQMEMSSDDVFSDYYDNILLISNDMGQFNVPSFGVYQITTMSPGDGYEVFLSGASDVDFSYPGAGFSRFTDMSQYDDLYNASISDYYDFVKTGISHPIILTSLNGMVEAGDEIAAYANGEVVGATKVVDPNGVTVIAAWGGYDQYGIELPGYTDGDAIELLEYGSIQQVKSCMLQLI